DPPLGQRLGVTAARGVAATVPGDQALGGPVGNHAGEQADSADRVVVARDRVVDLVRVAVRVQDRHDRDVQLARLGDSQVLLLGVDHPDGGGQLDHVPDPAEGAGQLVPLPALHEQLLLRVPAGGDIVEV